MVKFRGRNGEILKDSYDRKDKEIDTVCLRVHTSYDIDGLGNVDTVKAFVAGGKRQAKGIMHMNIVNNNKFSIGGEIYILIQGIVLEENAITFDKDMYFERFRGMHGQTSAILGIQHGILPGESCDIWIDLSKGFLPDDFYLKKIDILDVNISVNSIGKSVVDKVLKVEEL